MQLVSTTDREAVGHFLRLPEYIDLAIPRGGEGLIRRVAAEAKMPVIKHFTGNCHVYVDRAADLDMAERITINAKCQRMGVCNAAESLLVHADVAQRVFAANRRGADRQRSRDPRRRADVPFGSRRQAGERSRLRRRVLGSDHLGEGRRLARRSDRAHQSLRLASHRCDRDGRSGSRPRVHGPRRQRGGDGQRQHAIQRRRRIRPGRRNRHQHRQVPRPRPVRAEGTDELQVRRVTETGRSRE